MAILLTFLHHFGDGLVPKSRLWPTLWWGVDLFFVLSGFLITGILNDSVHEERYLRNFYIRRALRIFPLFYGLFLVILLLTPVLKLKWHPDMLLYFGFVANNFVSLLDLQKHSPITILMRVHGSPIAIGNLAALWSLCVEEQFYFVWPAVVYFVRDLRKLMWICGCVCVGVLILRTGFVLFHVRGVDHELLHLSTFARCDTLLMGAWLALWLRGTALNRRYLRNAAYGAMAIGVLLLLISVRFHPSLIRYDTPGVEMVGFSAIGIASTGLLLLLIDPQTWPSRIMRWAPLAWLGTISYGFYVIHDLPRYYLQWLWGQHARYTALIEVLHFVAVLLLAWLSFTYYERPFLRLKRRFAPQPRRGPLHVPTPH